MGDLLSHQSLTGVEQYTYQLARCLASSNQIELTLFSQHDIPKARIPQDAAFRRTTTSTLFGYSYLFSELQLPKKLIPFDVIHCPTVIFPLLIMLNKKIKKVMTVHDLVPTLFPEFSNIKKYIYYKYGLKPLFSNMDHLIVPSNSVKNDLSNLYRIDPEHISVINEGVSNQFRHLTLDKQNYILAVSTVEPRKNFKRIIDAFIFLKTTHQISEKLFIVGKRGWSCNDVYYIPKAFHESIIFKGYVPEADLVNLYQNAKLFVYPSLHEGFGLPIAEAMACGCPVVTSNCSSMPEVAGHAALLVDPHNVKDIASAMLRILNDEGLAISLAEKGLEQVRKFTWEKCARETIKVYEAVLSK
jgi:glycosyltransferase involved in cell wall biosynthesis